MTDTSLAALAQAPNREAEVLAALTEEPSTDWELHETLDCPYTSIQQPRGKLVREGKVRDSGRRRNTGYGRAAIVWEVIS